MRVAVKDACVLIDLANGGVLDAWFELGIPTHTTDLVLRQVKREEQWRVVAPFVDSNQLHVDTLSGDEVAEMLNRHGRLPIGLEDQSVIFVAEKLEAVLLTGDRRLRLESDRLGIEVRGVLWVLDRLVDEDIIEPSEAADALKRMLDEGARLPEVECRRRLGIWSGGNA